MVNDFLPPSNRGQRNNGQPQRPNNANNWQRPIDFHKPNSRPSTSEPQQLNHSPELNRTVIGAPFKPSKPTFRERLKRLSKKQQIIIGAAALIVIIGGTVAAINIFGGSDTTVPPKIATKPAPPPPPKPTTVASTLTGLQVAPEVNDRQVTAVMIENSLDARPQSGLDQAGVVFEAIAEGGITRFLTLFQDTEPASIGPVRSVRPYYVQWLMGFDAAVAHVGGSADALALIRQLGVKDLDQFANGSTYSRINTRFAPHNVYTSLPRLNELETRKGFTKSTYTGFARKDKETPSKTPNATSIDFNISGALYNSHYDYDAATNTYKRSEGGKPHTDEPTGAQLAPKVVIGLVMPQGRNGIYTTYQTIGSGQAQIFQDGVVTTGTWQKDSNTSNFVFRDANGAALKLNPGQTWLSVVGSSDRITFR
jgi:hypothetical protein